MIHRLIICLIAFLGFYLCEAQTTCKISQTGDTVEAFSAIVDTSGDKVTVSLGNDSKDTAANVAITIEVTYRYGSHSFKKQYTGKTQVGPMQTESLLIDIDSNWNGNDSYKPVAATVVSITGSKCL